MRTWNAIVKGAGYLFLFLLALAIMIIAAAEIERTIRYPHLNDGVITSKYADDGHRYYGSIKVGDYELRHWYGDGITRYVIEVTKDGKQDYWEVSEACYSVLQRGQTITRNATY